MSLLEFAQAVQFTRIATGIRESWYVYPVILSTHLAAIGITGGMLFASDMRLLGLLFRKQSVEGVVNRLRVPKRIGLLVIIACGALLASSKAEEYYYNKFFWIKMSLLGLTVVHALIFRPSVYNNTAELDRLKQLPGRAKLAGGLSLLLWICIACAGRGIGYIDPPLNKLHAQSAPAPALLKPGYSASLRRGHRAGSDLPGAGASTLVEF